MKTLSEIRALITEAKNKTETRITKKVIHSVEYKDEHGRWIHHADYDSHEEASTKGVRRARSFAKPRDWSGYQEPGRDRMYDPKIDR